MLLLSKRVWNHVVKGFVCSQGCEEKQQLISSENASCVLSSTNGSIYFKTLLVHNKEVLVPLSYVWIMGNCHICISGKHISLPPHPCQILLGTKVTDNFLSESTGYSSKNKLRLWGANLITGEDRQAHVCLSLQRNPSRDSIPGGISCLSSTLLSGCSFWWKKISVN